MLFPTVQPCVPLVFSVDSVHLAREKIPDFLLTEEKILNVAVGNLPSHIISHETCFCGLIFESYHFEGAQRVCWGGRTCAWCGAPSTLPGSTPACWLLFLACHLPVARESLALRGIL